VKGRVQVQAIRPSVEDGRYAAKACAGDRVIVGADIFRDGHDKLAATVRYRGPQDSGWLEEPLVHDVNDRWYGSFPVEAIGAWRYQVLGWTDHWATWLDAVTKKVAAGRGGEDLELDMEEGALLLERRKVTKAAKVVVSEIAEVLRDRSRSLHERVTVASHPDLLALLARNPERLDATTSKELPLWVDREAARYSAWYEMFPRSEGAVVEEGKVRSGTFADAAKRLPAIAEMGFDVVYLPPIHPIGRAHRKGPNNTLTPGPDDPGVPWAIGSPEGGHDAIHPDLGTLDDFDAFVEEAARHGLEIALDFAIQCSPDHPWVREHPNWFHIRPDGSIQYAQNPPKQYQDIYPIDFDTPDIEGLKAELKRVVDHWIAHGIRTFRVDNPHTKAIPFWEWLIAGVHEEHPDVLFLAEAFTRPKMMRTLGKVGFSMSYTYFAWRNTAYELTEYLTELTRTDMADYYRPHFWPNTPDILTEYLQTGGPVAFKIRLLLAATLSPGYGIYSGYELYEHVPVREGSEEYLDSEKYAYRPRDWSRPDSLAPWISNLNRIRSEHPSLHQLRNLWFHQTDGEDILAYSKVAEGRTDPLLVVVNLHPHETRATMTHLDLWQLGLENAGPFEAHDLLTGRTFIWHGPSNYVELDPSAEPAHVLALRAL